MFDKLHQYTFAITVTISSSSVAPLPTDPSSLSWAMQSYHCNKSLKRMCRSQFFFSYSRSQWNKTSNKPTSRSELNLTRRSMQRRSLSPYPSKSSPLLLTHVHVVPGHSLKLHVRCTVDGGPCKYAPNHLGERLHSSEVVVRRAIAARHRRGKELSGSKSIR